MKKFKLSITWLLVLTLFSMAILPTTAAYAFSLNDIVGATVNNEINDKHGNLSSGDKFTNLLFGLFLGKVLGKFFNISTPFPNNPAGSSSSSGKEVIGYYAEWWGTDTSSFNSMSKHSDSLSTIAPFWATLNGDGSLTDRGGNDHAAVVSAAHKNNISVLLMVNNDKQNDTDTPIHTVLADSQLRTKAIDNMEAYIKKYHLDGINIDFEMVPAQDRNNLSVFMKELSARLKPQGYIVSIAVFPKQDESNDVSVAYDYSELEKYADKIMIMTYDNHGVWSDAGPIADVRWVESNLKYALQFIPKNKVYLGLAAYGYDWSSKGVESLEYPAIMNLVQRFSVPVLWDDATKSPHFTYTGSDGVVHEVWFENSESVKYKLDLVNKYDIAGVAMWKLGEEDPNYWKAFKDKLSFKK